MYCLFRVGKIMGHFKAQTLVFARGHLGILRFSMRIACVHVGLRRSVLVENCKTGLGNLSQR